MKRILLLLVVIGAMVISGCVTPGTESFNLGQELARSNRLEEAIAMYEDALAKEPQNPEYAESLRKAKEALSGKHLEKAKTLFAQTPVTYDRAMSAYQEADKAARIAPDNRQAAALKSDIKSELDKLGKKAEAMYSEAMKANERNEWTEGVKKLRELNKFYPNYLDAASKLRRAEDNGVAYYLKEAEKSKKTEDWENTVKALTSAQEISPDRPEVVEGLKAAKLKHNADYYLKKAEEYTKANDWDMAMTFAQKASGFGMQADANKKIAMIKLQAAQHYVNQCGQFLSEKRLYSAYDSAIKAMTYDPSVKKDPISANVISQLLGAMAEKAAFYDNQGQLGNAFVWYDKIMGIDPNYQDIFFKVQTTRDKIRQRVIRKIAIMDFTPPTGSPDAGKIITDSLLAYITTHASSDVKILARDVLGAILKEIELGQAGLYDIESAKKAGRLQGTDVFIFGSVLNYNVDKNVSEGYKTVNVVIGKKSTPNPAYQMWLFSQKGGPSAEEQRNAPPATIDEDIRETFKYKVGTERKRSTVGVSFRVIDLEQGEVVITKTIKKSQEIKDDFSEGVESANIKYKALDMMSDSELLEKVTQEVVAELSHEVLSRFQNLQTQYFNLGETYKKKREYERAIEKYSDAVHLEEMKNISSPLSDSAKKEIELLLRQTAL